MKEKNSSASSKTSLKLVFISIFPSLLRDALDHSVLRRPFANSSAASEFLDLRDFASAAEENRPEVDSPAFGPGKGMVLRIEPLAAALAAAREKALPGSEIRSILLSPQGRVWNQEQARELAAESTPQRPLTLIFISGNYEGPDERFRELVDEEVSIGDYVLTGGELPALVVANTILRLLPGTIEADSRENDSFSAGRLDHPVYTRPLVWEGRSVPAILRSGRHAAIANWRRKKALAKTIARRPDLLKKFPLSPEEKRLLKEPDSE